MSTCHMGTQIQSVLLIHEKQYIIASHIFRFFNTSQWMTYQHRVCQYVALSVVRHTFNINICVCLFDQLYCRHFWQSTLKKAYKHHNNHGKRRMHYVMIYNICMFLLYYEHTPSEMTRTKMINHIGWSSLFVSPPTKYIHNTTKT